MKPGIVLVALAVVAVLGAITYLRAEQRGPAALRNLQPLPEPTGEERYVETRRGTKIWPRSVPLVEGVNYRYNTGHCGLMHVADFDGAFWVPHLPKGEKPPDFFINEEEGTLTVLSHERAYFRTVDGRSALLTRHEGPRIIEGCA